MYESIRFVPSSFNPFEPHLTGIRVPVEPWESGRALMSEYAGSIALFRIAPFWQWELTLHRAARDAGMVPYFVHPENTAVAAIAASKLAPAVIVMERRDASTIVSALTSRNIPFPQLAILIDQVGHDATIPPGFEHSQVAVELHSLPGVPSLYQCRHLVHQRAARFHSTNPTHSDTYHSDGPCACGAQTLIYEV